MPRFILIDPWLADVGGHNFQYALDVLEAAQDLNYQPVLAVNRSLSTSNRLDESWRILRVFRFGLCSRYWLGPDGKNPRPSDLDGKWIWSATSPPPSPMSRWADSLARVDRRRRILDFARGCRNVFETVNPTSDDVLFLPSMSEFDLLGLVRFLRDCPDTRPLVWNLQVHFNIFSGRDPEYAAQTETLHRCQLQFQTALQQIPDHHLRFYATTPAMARQFDQIGVASFEPLPYPVRDLSRAGERSIRHRPLRVTFAGGMRREKGKKKFGSLIANVWNDCLATRQLQFVFQAPRRQIAKWLPNSFRDKIVIQPLEQAGEGPQVPHLCTVRHPLDAAAYHQFIQQTNVGLFLYDSRRYFARASGIMGEMLAAGIPVIVPAGCWLGDQIAPQQYRHVESLVQSNYRQESVTLAVGGSDRKRTVAYSVPPGASDLAVQFSPPHVRAGRYFEVVAEFDDADGENVTSRAIVPPCTSSVEAELQDETGGIGILFPVPSAAKQVQIHFTSAYDGEPCLIEHVRLTPLTHPVDADHHPRSAVGLIATTEEDVPALLREVAAHYEHYRRSAERFSATWTAEHHPRRTIEILSKTKEVPRRGAELAEVS